MTVPRQSSPVGRTGDTIRTEKRNAVRLFCGSARFGRGAVAMPACHSKLEEPAMNRLLGLLALGLALAPASVVAQERLGDAGLGALSGAVVLGPIGAVGGAIIGYAAGPSIAHAWGLRRSPSARPGASVKRATRAAPPPPPPRVSSTPAADAQGTAEPAGTPARPAVQSVGTPAAMPPVQVLD